MAEKRIGNFDKLSILDKIYRQGEIRNWNWPKGNGVDSNPPTLPPPPREFFQEEHYKCIINFDCVNGEKNAEAEG